MAHRLGGDRRQKHRHDDSGDGEEDMAVCVILRRMLADDACFARAEKRDAGEHEQARGDVESSHCPECPPVEKASGDWKGDDHRREKREEARRRDHIADGAWLRHGTET